MYEGFHPRTRRLRWTLFLAAISVILVGTGAQAMDAVGGWLREESQRLPWYVVRVSALLAYLALTGSVVYGLLLSTGLLDRFAHRTVSFTLHQDLSAIGVSLALIHAAVLMIDRSVPFTPSQVLVPFSAPYRPIWVGIGQLALAVSLLVLLSFYVRKRIGQKRWRQVHYLSFLAFLGATVHGLMAGTDTAARGFVVAYAVLLAVVTFLLAYRIVLAVGARRERPRATPDRAPRPAAEGRAPVGADTARG
jgi:DMSO/TMAO reductase YedYZ heme-binding membrane subunit